MKKFFIFIGITGGLLLVAIAIALFVGIPSNPRDVVKIIEVKR